MGILARTDERGCPTGAPLPVIQGAVVRGKRQQHPEMLHFLEITDGLFALDNEAQGDGLYPSGGKSVLTEFVAEGRRDLVAIETVEHTPPLLGEKEAAVDLPWRSNRLVDGRLGNLVEGDPLVDVFLA